MANTQVDSTGYEQFIASQNPANSNVISGNWKILREQLLLQWDRLTLGELENTGHNRLKIARLIRRKYGISTEMAVNYLYNFERTLPLLGCA
jgi:hypothetical protein